MNILVTGHKGEAGSVIINSLRSSGHNCFPYENSNSNVNIIVHAAAKHPNNTANDIFLSNIIYHKKVVDNCHNLDSNMVFLSSVSVYAKNEKSHIDENDCVSSSCFYGASKIFGEKYIEEKNIDGFSLRLPAILALKNRSNLMGRIIENLVKNQDIVLTNSNTPFNSYIDPEDIAKFVVYSPDNKGMTCLNFSVDAYLTLYETVCILKELISSESIVIQSKNQADNRIYLTDKLKKITDFEFEHPQYILERWVNRMKNNGSI
jgi:nucleoside-diphosphate-sugar epimerase